MSILPLLMPRALGGNEGLGREVCRAVVLLEVVLEAEGELVLDDGNACPRAVGIVVVLEVGIPVII